MSDQTNIYGTVRKFIADKLRNEEDVRVQWLTHEIITSFAAIEGDDLPFYRTCAYKYVGEAVKRVVGKFEASNPDPRQPELVMAGFDHLQAGYTVERDGERVLVPTTLLSYDELSARADELDQMARGCQAHAKEIRQYMAAKQIAAE